MSKPQMEPEKKKRKRRNRRGEERRGEEKRGGGEGEKINFPRQRRAGLMEV